jgi:hypothetical protein
MFFQNILSIEKINIGVSKGFLIGKPQPGTKTQNKRTLDAFILAECFCQQCKFFVAFKVSKKGTMSIMSNKKRQKKGKTREK